MRKKLVEILTVIFTVVCFAMGCNSAQIKNEFDTTKLPYYVEDTDALQYSYTDEERVIPFWHGNVIRNEQLMIVEKDGVTQGKLLYTPKRIISVRDWTLNEEYVEGVDYTVSGNIITLPTESSVPVFKDKWNDGEDIPAEYPEDSAQNGWQWAYGIVYTESGLTWKHYIHVTYVYDPVDVDRTVLAGYTGDLHGLEQRIKSKDPTDKKLKMAVFGDSISEGYSSSKKQKHDPQCPPYAELVKYGLEHFAGLDVVFKNMSVSGKMSAWAADVAVDDKYGPQLPQLQDYAPDLLILAFGTNEPVSELSNQGFRKNIEKVIDTVKNVNSECQVLLVAPFPSHEGYKTAEMHEIVCTTLKTIVEETSYLDVAYVSMYEVCVHMLATKNYYEIAANNINHPNDFIHRLYAMQILSKMIDFNDILK